MNNFQLIDNSTTGINHFPNILQAVALSLLVLLLSLITGISMEYFFGEFLTEPGKMVWLNLPVFALVFCVGLVWSKRSIKYFIHQNRISLPVILIIPITTFGILIVLGELSNCMIYFFPIPESIYAVFENLLTSTNGLFAAIFVAAFTEELLFRGMILTGLSKLYSEKKAIIISAVLFGAIHIIPWQVFPAIGVGIFLGWVYVKFKSIWLCIGIHALNNAIAAIPVYMSVEIPGLVYDVRDGVQFQPLWLDAAGVIFVIFGIMILNSLSKKTVSK